VVLDASSAQAGRPAAPAYSRRVCPKVIVAAAAARTNASALTEAGGGVGGGGRGAAADGGSVAAADGGADAAAAADAPHPNTVAEAPSFAPATARLTGDALRKDWDGWAAIVTANLCAAAGAAAAGADGASTAACADRPAADSRSPSRRSSLTCWKSAGTTLCLPPARRFWPTNTAQRRRSWGGPSKGAHFCSGAVGGRWGGGGGAPPGLRPADASGRSEGGGRGAAATWPRRQRCCVIDNVI